MNTAQILRNPRVGDMVQPLPGFWKSYKSDSGFLVIAANEDNQKMDIEISEMYKLRWIKMSDFIIISEGPEPKKEEKKLPEKEYRKKPDPAHPPAKKPEPAKYDPATDNFWD